MSSNALNHTPPSGHIGSRRTEVRGDRAQGTAHHVVRDGRAAWRGLLGLPALGVALCAAAGLLGARTWQVGSGLGTALFPVEDIVELAAVAVGTVVAGRAGLHALVALACVLLSHRGRRWAAGERTVARHAPALIRRLAHAAAGAGIGLALAAPTAVALPAAPGVPVTADAGPAVVLDLSWQPTVRARTDGREAKRDRQASEGGAPDRSVMSHAHPAPERSSLVNRGLRTGSLRAPLVVVEPGDTLWAISAERLADGGRSGTGNVPSDAEIADSVTQWHNANRDVLGSDPDLIRPGTVLHLP